MTREQALSLAHDRNADHDTLYAAASTLLANINASREDLDLAGYMIERAQRLPPKPPAPGDDEGEEDDGPEPEDCAHDWEYTGTAYGGDDPSYFGEGRCYCSKCGADGDG